MSAVAAHSARVADAVERAVATVDDPEYPGVSIVDLGLLERVEVGPDGAARVDLVPTYAGCPALDMIRGDVDAAVRGTPGVTSVEVRWLATPLWSPERITPRARAALAREFTVVLRDRDGTVRCPVCASREVSTTSPVGPTRCRSVAWCASCRNAVEVVR